MKDPPITLEADGLSPQPRKLGHRWADLAIAGAAILLSLISLGVAMENSRTQAKLLAATSWPFLKYTSGNYTGGEKVITLNIRNGGVGPALVEWVRVRHEGRPVASTGALLQRCCEAARPRQLELVTSTLTGSVIPAGEELTFIALPYTAAHAETWDSLNSARFHLEFEACYCSVLGECWRSDLQELRPRRIKRCGPSTDVFHE